MPGTPETVRLSASGTQRAVGPEGWLPRWLPAATEAGGLFRSLCDWWVEATDSERDWAARQLQRQWLSTAPLGEERLRWEARLPFLPDDDLRVSFLCAAGSGSVTRARSLHAFEQALEPVYWIDRETRRLHLRGLHLRETSLISSGGVYTISGEAEGLVEDGDLHWRRATDTHWQRLPAEQDAVSGSDVTLPLTGTVSLRYPSQYYARTLASGTVLLERYGAASLRLPLISLAPDNLFDGYGRLCGLPRLDNESNRAYRTRLLLFLTAFPDSSAPGIARGVAARTGLLSRVYWNGISDLTLDATGASGITYVHFPELPPRRQVEELLAPLSGGMQTRFRSTFGSWQDGWLVLVDGIPRAGTAVSGNLVTLAEATSGEVLARYSLVQYTLHPNASGTIGSLRVGTGIASGSYQLVLVRRVQPYPLDLESYRRDRLLTASGLPNGLFLELASRLVEGQTLAWGRARWGRSAVWHLQAEDLAPPARLSLPFDADS